MGFGRLLLRGTIGVFFVGHGLQKLAGWFGGGGPAGTGQFFEAAGLRPGKRHALAAGAAETAGGALLAAGLATPLASALLSGVMFTAIERVHWRNGPWVTQNGFEYTGTLVAALFAVTEAGPGPLSADAALGIERRGLPWALGSLAAGGAGSALALTVGTEEPSPSEEPVTAEQQEIAV